jgi:hypothetical protein
VRDCFLLFGVEGGEKVHLVGARHAWPDQRTDTIGRSVEGASNKVTLR